MQALKKPQPLETLMRMLVLSRSIQNQQHQQQQLQQQHQQQLPLQLIAATATLGRPLHRRLAAFIRWKQQQLPFPRDPPLHRALMGGPLLIGKGTSLHAEGPLFLTPQQRMQRAYERMADQGILGLPRLQNNKEKETGKGDKNDSTGFAFKDFLAVVRFVSSAPSFSFCLF